MSFFRFLPYLFLFQFPIGILGAERSISNPEKKENETIVMVVFDENSFFAEKGSLVLTGGTQLLTINRCLLAVPSSNTVITQKSIVAYKNPKNNANEIRTMHYENTLIAESHSYCRSLYALNFGYRDATPKGHPIIPSLGWVVNKNIKLKKQSEAHLYKGYSTPCYCFFKLIAYWDSYQGDTSQKKYYPPLYSNPPPVFFKKNIPSDGVAYVI